MFSWRAIRRVVAVALVCVASAVAAAHDVPPDIDRVYRDLGRGDTAQALRDSALLLAHTPIESADRGAVLQARLDALVQSGDLDQHADTDLNDAIAAWSARTGSANHLRERFSLASAAAHGDVAGVDAIVRRLRPGLANLPASERMELRSALAFALVGAAGRFDQARTLAEPALATSRQLRGARARWQEIRLEHLLARAYATSGDESRALALLETASHKAAETFGSDSALCLMIDNARAGQLSSMGRNREGLKVRESVLAGTRRRFGAASLETAKAEAMVGSGLQEIGDYPAAREHFSRARELLERIGNAPAREQVIIYANFGNLLQEMGAENEALDSYRHALGLLDNGPKNAHIRAIIFANIGNTEYRLRRYATAKADFLSALALREQADGKRSPGLAYSLEGLGSASLALRDYADAERYFRRALTLRGLRLTPYHPTLSPLRFGLALARWGRHDERGAFDLAVAAARHQQAMLESFAVDFAERQSIAYRKLLAPVSALAVTLAARLGDRNSIATAWRLTVVERGLVARAESYRLAAARARTDADAAAALARWQRINAALGDAWFSADGDQTKIAALSQQAEEAERAMWPRGISGRQVPAAPPSVDNLARALPDDGLLIAYAEGVASDPSRLLPAGDQVVPEDWYAFSIDHKGSLRLVRLGDIRALSAQIHAWYLDLRSPDADPDILRQDGFAVRRALLDPIPGSRGAGHLFVMPEGEMYRMSFSALPAARGRGYLIDSRAGVHVLASESDLLLPSATVSHPFALLAGAPDFAQAAATPRRSLDACGHARAAEFAPIPQAGRELDALRDLLGSREIGANILELRGARATKQRVIAALSHANLVHLATHGFAVDGDCNATAGARGVSLAGPTPGNDAVPGVALSGLAFAPDAPATEPDDAGVLSAGELATLDLSRLGWIVLSACDSGLGWIDRNEGVFGMRRALRIAGARTVVMSLWQVDDTATAAFMQALYRARFVERRNVSDAMGQAMRAVLRQRRDAGLSDSPYFWAAFVSEGAWR